jgi:CPA1 family monovalent cation:H+ antiporter
MDIRAIMMLLAGMLLLALLIYPLAARYRLPLAAVLVTVGFIGSEAMVALGWDTGIRHDSFHDLIFYVFLPLLVFDAAFKIDARLLWQNLVVILILAIPLMLLSTVVSAAMIYYGIGHPTGFPWIAALLTGALLSATDPLAISELLRRVGMPRRLAVLIDGEALFNDATAIVTFGIFLYIAQHPTEHITFADASIRFGVVFFGGMLVGLLVGLAFLLLSRLFHDPVQQGVVTLISAYASYLVAEDLLYVSGVMAVLITGLIMGRVIHSDFQGPQRGFVDDLWSFSTYLSEALVFLLMGVTVTLGMFEERWLAMLIGIAAILLARALGIFGAVPLINRLPGARPIPMTHRRVLYLSGTRGAVTLALALSIPTELDYWWTIQAVAFGVVLFTLFTHLPYMEPLLRRSGLAAKSP